MSRPLFSLLTLVLTYAHYAKVWIIPERELTNYRNAIAKAVTEQLGRSVEFRVGRDDYERLGREGGDLEILHFNEAIYLTGRDVDEKDVSFRLDGYSKELQGILKEAVKPAREQYLEWETREKELRRRKAKEEVSET